MIHVALFLNGKREITWKLRLYFTVEKQIKSILIGLFSFPCSNTAILPNFTLLNLGNLISGLHYILLCSLLNGKKDIFNLEEI